MTIRAVVLAAGKGTRMKSARPKVLHELCGRPMLWYTLRALRDAGVSEIVVISNPELQPHLEAFDVSGVIQEPQNGTGHAVQVALGALRQGEGHVVIAMGDMPLVGAEVFREALSAVDSSEGVALALVTARMPLPSNFGRIVRDGDGVAKIVEERDATPAQRAIDEMNAGIYVFREPLLRSAIAGIDNNNAQGEYYLTDTVAALHGAGHRVMPVQVSNHHDVLGVNDRVELARARSEMNGRLCEQYMRAGATIVDPATTYLEPELSIGRDTIIYPNTSIGRLSEIGQGCVLGPNTRLSAAILGDNVNVRESVITDSRVGNGVSIGPFAHLRGQSELRDNVKIGNFVELKNAKLANGVKANHLSYLGDATIGEETNVGAGTITCNYDGVRKNKTEIGKNVAIGSNTSIIAPRTIGDDALTGAGSVITKDVAAGERVAGNPARPLRKQ